MESLEVEEGQKRTSKIDLVVGARHRAPSVKRSLILSDEDLPKAAKAPWTMKDVLGMVAATASAILMVGFIYTVFAYEDDDNGKVCRTNSCKYWAQKLQVKMNLSVDPCEDFYEYACGGWINKRGPEMEEAGYYSEASTQTRLDARILETLRELLETKKHKKVSGMIQQVFDFYAACMDNETIEARGGRPLFTYLANVSIETSDNEADDRRNFAEQIGSLARWGMTSLISLSIEPDLLDSSIHTIYVGQGTLMLSAQADYVSKDPTSYNQLIYLKNYIASLMSLSAKHLSTMKRLANEKLHGPRLKRYLDSLKDGMDFSQEKIELRALEVVKFEQKIAEAMAGEDIVVIARDEYHPKVVDELMKEEPVNAIDWRALLNSFLSESTAHDAKRVVSIAMRVPEYFYRLGTVLSATPFDVLVDYLRVRVLYFSAMHLSGPYVQARRTFKNYLTGSTREPPRWKHCCRFTNDALGFALGSAFIARNWTGQSKERSTTIINDILASFSDSLDNSSWMDAATRMQAQEKVNGILKNVGQPSSLSCHAEVEEFYQDLDVHRNDYFGNQLRSVRFQWNLSKQYLFDERARANYGRHWQIMPAQPLSHYSKSRNALILTAGILQPPLFHATMPSYLNFGGIGTIIAHALMHGFDEVGSKYDSTGTMNIDWPPQVRTDYEQAAQCFGEQYSKYRVKIGDAEYLSVNGNQTRVSNIAINGGLKHAYHAYIDHVKKHFDGREEPTLPLLELTPRQVFFVSFAVTYCAVATPEKRRSRLLYDSSAPPKYRVLGALANSEDFAREFKCEKGRPMNPAEKCSLL